MKKPKILIFHSNRSDHALTAPIIEACKSDPFFECYALKLIPFEHPENFTCATSEIKRIKPDVVYATGDRLEMHAAALAAFYQRVPIMHYGSGITNTIATFDDINRHAITLYADLCLCESVYAAEVVKNLKRAINDKHSRKVVRVVGNLYLEGIDDVDESLVPNEEYDLVLINPITLSELKFDLNHRNFNFDFRKKVIWIGPNDDWKTGISTSYELYYNIPRPQFLGLMKNCQRFITNSSSSYYEAPYYLKPEQIILVGERNKLRGTYFESMPDGALDAIIREIKEWWKNVA